MKLITFSFKHFTNLYCCFVLCCVMLYSSERCLWYFSDPTEASGADNPAAEWAAASQHSPADAADAAASSWQTETRCQTDTGAATTATNTAATAGPTATAAAETVPSDTRLSGVTEVQTPSRWIWSPLHGRYPNQGKYPNPCRVYKFWLKRVATWGLLGHLPQAFMLVNRS